MKIENFKLKIREGFAAIPVILGAVVTVVAAVVLVLGVQRVKDLQTVLQRPKATGISWPSCVQDQSKAYWCTDNDCFNASDDSRNINKCCSKVKSDPFACAWPARGWCKPPPEQCPDSGGQRCGLYFFNSGSGCYGYNSGDGGGGSCVPASLTPADGATNVSTTQTLSWSLPQAPANYVNAYLWSCAAKTENCGVFGAVASPYTSIPVTGFYRDNRFGANFEAGSWNGNNVALLNPSKQYWWTVNVDGNPSCSSVASFTTGAGIQPVACGSATVSSNTLSSGGSVAITGTATKDAVGFAYGFYNLDNLYGPNNPKPIFFDGSTQYVPSHTVSPRTTDTLTVNFSDIDKPDNNAGGVKPKNIQVNVFFADAAGNSTHSDPKCVVQFAVTATCVDSQCPDTSSCQNNVCRPVKCPKPPTDGCSNYVVKNHKCELEKSPDGTACGTADSGNTCQNGVCTVPVECDADAKCSDDKKCNLTTNKCVVPTCSPEPGVCQTAEYKNHACSLINKADGTVCETNKVCSNGACVASEANACWDNKGVNGKCYDCNGDGTINILDFSCFQKHWLENVQ